MRAWALVAFGVAAAACTSSMADVSDTGAFADALSDAALVDLAPTELAPDVPGTDAVDVQPDACICGDGKPCSDYKLGQCPVFVGATVSCMPCSNDADCNPGGSTGSFCVISDKSSGSKMGLIDGRFCLTPCAEVTTAGDVTELTCATGFHCQTVKCMVGMPPAKLCILNSGDCSCTEAWSQQGKSTQCHKFNAWGDCTSKRTCGFDANGKPVLSVCDAPPPAQEVCGDNVDNDCNGKTDEAGSQGCENFCLDGDGDGYGSGTATADTCVCTNPGPGYSNLCGDCNDLSPGIKPGSVEICDNIDNNCNGTTDEAGSKGCTVYCHDLDGDGFGSTSDTACLCKSKATTEWVLQCGDCDDTPGSGFASQPGVDEVCDGIDNNCNGKTDEQGAVGCTLFYADQDGDGYGVTTTGLCLCGPTKGNPANASGDCDDSNPTLNPGMDEVCDGIDNDCSGAIDDNYAELSCASGSCVNGSCGSACPAGFVDLNASATDGCECAFLPSNAGSGCGNADDLGALPEGSTLTASGQILPGESGDWYSFYAVDTPDVVGIPVGNCDLFDVHIAFLVNPGDGFVFDVYRGSCGDSAKVCSAETVHDWSVNFSAPWGGKKYPAGECNCVPANAVAAGCINGTGCGPNGFPGMNVCSDDSAKYYIRVYRKSAAPFTCASYSIQFSNTPMGIPPFP